MRTIQHPHRTSSEPGVISSVSVASFPERERIEQTAEMIMKAGDPKGNISVQR